MLLLLCRPIRNVATFSAFKNIRRSMSTEKTSGCNDRFARARYSYMQKLARIVKKALTYKRHTNEEA